MSSWDQSQGGGGGGGSRQQPPGGGGSGGGSGPPDHNKNVNPKGPPLPPPMMRGTSHGGGGGYGGNSNNNDPGGSGGIFPNSVPSSNFGGGGGRGRFGGGRHGGRFGGRGRHHGGRGLGRGGHPPHHRGSFSGGHPSGPPRIGRDRDERGGMIDNPPFGGERERDHHHPHSSPREMSGDFRGRGGDKFRGGDDGPSFRDRDVHRDSSLGPPPVRDSPFRHAGGGGDRFERTRSDGAISSPYPSGLERRTSFDQQRGPFPRGPRDFDSRDPGRGPGGGGPPPPQHWKDHRRIGSHGSHGSHGPIQSDSSPGASQPKVSSAPPFMTAPPMPSDRAGSIAPTDPRSRPTDPRRRGTSSNDLPSTQGSYSSLAESTGPSSPSAVKGFRSSPQAMRRSISDAGVGRGYDRVGDNVAPSPRVAKSMRSPSDDRPQYPSMPPADLNGPQQRQSSRGGLGPKPMDFHSSSSSELGGSGGIKEPVFASRRDPRSQYTDGPSSTGNASADAALNSQDPFGRTREWQQPRAQQLRRASSEGTVPRPSPRPSPSRAKSILSLTPINEKSVLQAPSLGSSTIAAAAAAAASGSSTVVSKVAAEEKPVQIEELPSLKISSLGDEEVVKRAETAVLHLHEVVPDDTKDKQTTDDLPSKANMLEAMSKIEKLITASQNGMNDLSDEISKAKAREADLQAKEAKERAEEERKKSLELERIQNEKRMEEIKLKENALQGALNEFKERSAEEKKKMQGEFDLSVEAAKEKVTAEMNAALAADISQDSVTIDKGISKAERELEQSRMLLQKVGEKVASAEKTYRILLAEEQKEEDYDSGNSGVDPSSVVSSIFVENKRKAEEAQLLGFALADGISKDLPSEKEDNGNFLEDSLYETKDPTCFKTFEEWAVMAQSVTGLSDALYSEPSEAPYYQFNEKRHEEMGPIVKEYIRSHKTKLNEHWKRLSEEYEVRKRLYEKQQRKLAKKSRGSISAVKKSIFAGNTETPAKESDEKEGKAGEAAGGTGGRSTNNPYRRARRGDPVRSEYEQEQIIAQITEKEAMEKRITHGGSKLPRQICPLEQELSAIYVNTFNSQRVDPAEEAREEAMTNIWTDMEKCIFLDRFLQFPKDFRRIASFLRNKTTQDCIAFYYDSKQTVPYKGALKEHILRRKRKGEYQVWDASIQSAVSCGAIISAGDDDEKPINFGLPVSDLTYRTCMLHPLRREALDSMEIDVASAEAYVSSGGSEEETTKWKSRKRGRDPLFSLSKEQTKRLRKSSQEALMNPIERAKLEEKEKAKIAETEPGASTPKRQAPQKWTATEKKIFVETLEEHGRDWAKLSQAVGTKSISQIKNFYYDFKKQLSSGKFRQGMEKGNFKSGPVTIASGSGEPSPAPKAKEESLKSPRQKLLKKKKKGAGGGVPPSLPKLGSKSMVKKTVAQNQAAVKRSRSATPTESAIPIPHDVLMQQEEMVPRNEAQLHYQNQMSANPPMHSNELERILAGNPSYGGPNYASQTELIQHLLQQQQQQQPYLHHQSHPDHQYIADAESHLAARLLQQQQQQAQQRDQQSSLELFLRGQNSQQGLALEDTRRLLQQQSQNYPHLQPQHGMPSGLQETAAAAPDLSDTSNIRRFLQLQQQHNPLTNQRSNLGSLLGLSSAADTGISASLLAQLRGGQPQQAAPEPSGFGNIPNVQGFLGGGQQHQHQAQHQHQHQLGGQLPGGLHSSHNPMYHHTGSGASAGGQPDVTQSEAFALLQRAMQRDRNNFG